MKTVLFLLLCSMTFCLPFKKSPSPAEAAGTAPLAVAPTGAVNTDTVSFASQIQPILQSRCSPCHFPGGKMYEKMPFDRAKTVIGHPEGILKRIKDEKENALLKRFIEEASR